MLARFCQPAKQNNKQAKIHVIFKIILRITQVGETSHLPPLTLTLNRVHTYQQTDLQPPPSLLSIPSNTSSNYPAPSASFLEL